ncbi:response regulator transcription factor [Luteimonas sp. FXH3W]|uniref:Response regulator transcription factor n=1 Tax=Aquilutibacter rugosus TaxID=3115820 RepID=A0ABU7V3V1_9GAMM
MHQILIADDHPLFRAALRAAATEAIPGVGIHEADSLESVLQTLDAQPDIELLLLDLHMPGNHGLAGLASIRAQHPVVAVMVVSANDDPLIVRRALDFGAAGFLPKSSGLDDLNAAISTILNCGQWLPESIRATVLRTRSSNSDADMASKLSSLSPQQFRVLRMVADGLLNKQIADRLNVQERTVKAHVSAIFERLGVRNRTQAGIVLRELELTDPGRVPMMQGQARP